MTEQTEQIEQELADAQQGLKDARRKLATWKRRRDDALNQLHDSFDADDAETERYKRSVVLAEAREAVQHFGRKVKQHERAIKQHERALMQARYEEGVPQIRKVRQEAADEIEALEAELWKTAKELYHRAWTVQEEANREINSFNSRVVNAVGQRAEHQVKKMNGLRADAWVEAVLREAVLAGQL